MPACRRTRDGPGRNSDRARGTRHTNRRGRPRGAPARLVAELSELEAESDFVLVDAGSGLGPAVGMLAAAVTRRSSLVRPSPPRSPTPHAAIGRFRRLAVPPRLRVLVNQTPSASEAVDVLDQFIASSRQFLGAVVSPLGPGSIRADPHVPLAVRGRRPFLTAYPGSVASRAFGGWPVLWSESTIRQAESRRRLLACRPGHCRSWQRSVTVMRRSPGSQHVTCLIKQKSGSFGTDFSGCCDDITQAD